MTCPRTFSQLAVAELELDPGVLTVVMLSLLHITQNLSSQAWGTSWGTYCVRYMLGTSGVSLVSPRRLPGPTPNGGGGGSGSDEVLPAGSSRGLPSSCSPLLPLPLCLSAPAHCGPSPLPSSQAVSV